MVKVRDCAAPEITGNNSELKMIYRHSDDTMSSPGL